MPDQMEPGTELAIRDELLSRLADGCYAEVATEGNGSDESLRVLATRLADRAAEDLHGVVDVAVDCGDAMYAVAEMTRGIREANNRAQAIAAAAEEMVSSVNEIARTSDAAAGDADAMQQSVDNAAQAADRASDAMGQITRAVEDAAAKVDALATASQEIGVIVESIEAIAKQTNLLALNATIEAARAGEAGKGFAVVASEVKNLANQTAKATDDIRNRIGQLRDEMTTIVESMQQGAEAVHAGEETIVATSQEMRNITDQIGGVTGKMQEIASILSQQGEASSDVAKGVVVIAEMSDQVNGQVNTVADCMDRATASIGTRLEAMSRLEIAYKVVELARFDHIKFRNRIMDAAIGRTTIEPAEIADHHACRLGSWYYAVTDERVKNDPAFHDLEEPHARVHTHGRKAVEKLVAGELDEALEDIQSMSDASAEVLQQLLRLSQNLANDGSPTAGRG